MSKEIKFNVRLNVDGKEQLVTAAMSAEELGRNLEEAKGKAGQMRDALVTFTQSVQNLQNLGNAVSQISNALNTLTADSRKGGGLCERALEIIEQHYMDEDLSLASLSAMLDVSPNHLSACIKKTAGETFINILVRRRMEAAQKLLLTTDLQVQEIARRCGYSDQHYFSYCFKKYSGTSPGALRRQRAAQAAGEGAVS